MNDGTKSNGQGKIRNKDGFFIIDASDISEPDLKNAEKVVLETIIQKGNHLQARVIYKESNLSAKETKAGINENLRKSHVKLTQKGTYAKLDAGVDYLENVIYKEPIKQENSNEHLVLSVISRIEDSRPTAIEVSTFCKLHKGQCSSACSKLFEKGLVDRARTDGIYTYWITVRGLEELDRLPSYGTDTDIYGGLK